MKKKGWEPIKSISIICLILGLTAINASIVLLIFKFCGFPLFYEALLIFFGGIILLVFWQLIGIIRGLIDALGKYAGYVEMALRKLKETQPQAPTQPPMGGTLFMDGKNVNLGSMSKEELEDLKNIVPSEYATILDMFITKNPDEPKIPKKPLKKCTLNELYVLQKAAADDDNFEQAQKIKNEIKKRGNV